MKKFVFLSVLVLTLSTIMPSANADDGATAQKTHPSKKVSADVHATLAFTACVAKLLNSGLAAQEARQLCTDTISN